MRPGDVDWARYEAKAALRHRPLVLHHLGILPFNQVAAHTLTQLPHFARQLMSPEAVFRSAAAEYLRAHRWEGPSCAPLAGVSKACGAMNFWLTFSPTTRRLLTSKG